MPLAPGLPERVGLGLWNSVPGTLLVELSLLAAYAGAAAGPPPPGVPVLAVTSILGAALLLALAAWVDRHRAAG